MATLPLARPQKKGTDDSPGATPPLVAGPPPFAFAVALLAVLGVVLVWPTALQLWALWSTDALKSIGGLVPIVALWLTWRAWRSVGWERQGSLWGLLVLALTAALVALRQVALAELVFAPGWSITLPPHSLVAVLYAAGFALVAGGVRLLRAACFPVLLMLLVNPVPHLFNTQVDLPLQHAAATVARGLAHLLGQKLTPDQLSLMFTPEFGMFIAPGCNGIRGAVTMGILALVAAHLYRLRWRPAATLVAAAVLLGYVFNLVRLCALVFFYVVALHVPWLQRHAEGADYLLGAALFFAAAMLLAAAVRRFSPGHSLQLPTPQGAGATRPVFAPRGREGGLAWARLGALAALCALMFLVTMHGGVAQSRVGAHVAFPARIGTYALQRTWIETLDTGEPIFSWAEYARPGEQGTVQMGISTVLGAHDTLLCHVARGERWEWREALPLPTVSGPVPFTAVELKDGITTALEASTLCNQAGCGQWSSGREHMGFVWSRVSARAAWSDARRPASLLLRVEQLDENSPAKVEPRQQLLERLKSFSANASFDAFQYRYLRP